MSLAPLLKRDASDAIEERLRAFREQGVLGSVDVHTVDHLSALVGESDPEVLLALALAVRAPSKGHICIDLADLESFGLRADASADAAAEPEPLSWPSDTKAWLERIAASPLVRAPGDQQAHDTVAPFVLDGSVIYTDRYFSYQSQLAAALRTRVQSQLAPHDAALLRRGLDGLFEETDGLDRQKLGAAMAMLRGLTVIAGGPGTGKTYTVRTVLTLLWAQWALEHDPSEDVPGPRVALAAPTGKAAARMAEALASELDEFLQRAAKVLPEGRSVEELRAFLTALQPSTIHRLLRYNPANPSRFKHHAKDPVPHQVVVIDEASMIPFALMAKLVDAVAPDARLILLGDKYQLASVEAGTVLADMCGPTRVSQLSLSKAFAAELHEVAGVHVSGKHGVVARATTGPSDAIVQLDRSRRFSPSSGIGQFAKACLADDFNAEAAVDILTDDKRFEDVHLLQLNERAEIGDEVAAAIVDGYRPMLERLRAGPKKGESLPELHAAVLEAFGRFRVLCAHRRGRSGVDGMNRAVVALLKQQLRGFNPSGEFWLGRPILIRQNDYVVELFNGDTGIVVKDGNGKLTVAFPKAGGIQYLAPSRLPDHQTVFAMTIHKSQGSEFEHVMVVLPTQDSPILTRELIYTAVTRGKKHMTLVGTRELLVPALKRSVRRASGLEAALWGPA